MRFASLGSGSRGNALLVECAGTRILLDCGFGPRILANRLARLGLAVDAVDAVLLTHEHSDHVAGIDSWARRRVDIFATHGTLAALALSGPRVHAIDSHGRLVVGGLELLPFPVPHDAREPVQFVFSDGARRLGIVTDAGHVTRHMVEMLTGCDALVIECNHDADLLAGGRYPPMLKRRIAGRYGHLENAAAASLLDQVERGRLQHVVAAHLSQENNTPALAQAALAAVLGCTPDCIGVASQDKGFDWRQIR